MTSTPNTGYLIEDQWDDWFQYSTMYDLYIVDSLSHQCYMGKTKIGQKGMVEDQRRPALPESFSRLSEDFFSLGQDSYYYENIKNLGDVMRSEILAALNDIAYNTNKYRPNSWQSAMYRALNDEWYLTKWLPQKYSENI